MTKDLSYITDYQAPDEGQLQLAELFFAARKFYNDPVFLHLDRVPENDTRLLFVGNHSLFAWDVPLMWLTLRRRKNLNIRPLGDKFLFQIASLKRWIQLSGGVEGTHDNCRALMQSGQPVLVYPGGSREALHRRGMAHQLDWGERAGFAQMACDHGYTIVPFACVGIDDQWHYVLEGQEIAKTPLGRRVKKSGLIDRDELFPPVVTGVGPTPIPKPNRHYYAFGKPIPTSKKYASDPTEVWVIREDTRIAVEELIQELLEYRDNDPKKDYRLRFANQFLNAVDTVKGTFKDVLEELENH